MRQSQERQDWDEAGMLGNRDLTVALVIEAHAGHWTCGDQTCDNACEVRISLAQALSPTCFRMCQKAEPDPLNQLVMLRPGPLPP